MQFFADDAVCPDQQSNGSNWVMKQGDCLEVMKSLPDDNFDSVVTDPPYALSTTTNDPSFIPKLMTAWLDGKSIQSGSSGYGGAYWDALPVSPEIWKQVYRILKPGAYAAVFSAARTDDLTKLSLRLGGFEINDSIAFIVRDSFPKYQDVGRAIEKRLRSWGHKPDNDHEDTHTFGTSLKGSAIKESLYREKKMTKKERISIEPSTELSRQWSDHHTHLKSAYQPIILAKKPIWSDTVDNIMRYGVGALNIGKCRIPSADNQNSSFEDPRDSQHGIGKYPANVLGHLGEENEKYFLNPTNIIGHRTRPKDRDTYMPDGKVNDHPTVKPYELLEWLTCLVTPKGGTILDPFSGSGSTGIAAIRQGFGFTGIELSPHYHDIAESRLRECEKDQVGFFE
jgi:DNA modification methylase